MRWPQRTFTNHSVCHHVAAVFVVAVSCVLPGHQSHARLSTCILEAVDCQLASALGLEGPKGVRLSEEYPPGKGSRPTSGATILERRHWRRVLDGKAESPWDTRVLGAKARAWILLGEPDVAARLLESARASATVSDLVDLSAAYLVKAARSPMSVDTVRALDAAERALSSAPGHPAASNNRDRALAILRQVLPDSAGPGTTPLRPPASGLAIETAAIRGVVEEALHAEGPCGSDGGGREANPFFADVRRQVCAFRTTRHWQAHGSALQAFRRGLEAVDADDLGQAQHEFAQALGGWHGESALGLYSRIRLAVGVYYQGDLSRAASDAVTIAAQAERQGYVVLSAWAHRVAGICQVSAGRYEPALAQYGKARGLLEAHALRDDAAMLGAYEAEVLDYLSLHDEAWHRRLDALVAYRRRGDPMPHQSALVVSTIAALEQGLPGAATHFQRAASTLAMSHGRLLDRAEARVLEVRVALASGRRGDAMSAVRQAVPAVAAIADPALRSRNQAELSLARAAVGDLDVSELDPALRYFGQSEALARLTEVLEIRATVLRSAGRLAAARTDLALAAEVFERRAGLLDDQERRLSHERTGRALYESWLDLELDGGAEPWSLLHIAERARRRLDPQSVPDLRRFRLRVQRLVDQGDATLVVSTVLADRLLVWTLEPQGRLRLRVHGMRAGELAARVEAVVLAVHRNEALRLRTEGRALTDTVLGDVGGSGRLWLVPDLHLRRVPWAAMPTTGGSMVIDRWALAIRPSVLGRPSRPRIGEPAALVVGSPRVTGQGLLLGAARETRAVAALYPGSWVLDGPSATRDAVLPALQRAEVLHFGGHAIANPERPLLSHFLLPGGGGQATLFAHELRRMPLDHLRLAVLAACRSADAASPAAEGLVSLADALLDAGTTDVVASLGDLDDRAASTLFVGFHRRYRATGDASASLRNVQRELAKPGSSVPMSEWAGVIILNRTEP